MLIHLRLLCDFTLYLTTFLSLVSLVSDTPNMFTEKGYTKEHRQNVQNLVDNIDLNKRNGIVEGRNTKGFNDVNVWKMILQARDLHRSSIAQIRAC
jgi:hypothetical protein